MMTTYALIVEDEESVAETIAKVLADLSGVLNFKVARSRDSASSLLDTEFFDLVVLDLNIPTDDGLLDSDPQHGLAVFTKAQSVTSGTPIFVLTGSSAEDFIPDLLRGTRQVDIWGEGKTVGTVHFLPKFRFDQFPNRLKPLLDGIAALGDVELDKGNVKLDVQDDRLIRIFARKFGGTRIVASSLGGGLSGAKVLRLKVTDAQGAPIHDAVAKLGTRADVAEEGRRFDQLVSRLEPRCTPRKLLELDAGAGANAGVFYGLAAGFERTAFAAAPGSAADAAVVVAAIKACTSRWADGVQQSRRAIQEVRRLKVSDETCQGLMTKFGLEWLADFETRQIQTRWCCTHGDLHGENVLLDNEGRAVIIDYGDVGEATASLDPVTLELSLLFHPKGPLRDSAIGLSGWPSEAQARNWGNIDMYVADCTLEHFVRECRAWALEVAAGQREVAATAYAYLLRQLKYEDTNKELALALLKGVRAFYENT
jgi:CheY-like chemotaxis protein